MDTFSLHQTIRTEKTYLPSLGSGEKGLAAERIRLDVHVPFSNTYPNTPFRRSQKNIADLVLFYYPRGTEKHPIPFLYLQWISVHTVESVYATVEEKQRTKGLGKKMLCNSVALLKENSAIPDKTLFYLEAVSSKHDMQRLINYYKTYGFQPNDDVNNVKVRLVATVSDVVSTCENAGL